MTSRSKTLLHASMLLVSLACLTSRAEEDLQKQASAFLLGRYETVVSARSRVLAELKLNEPNLYAGPKYLGLPFIYLMGGLKVLGPNAISAVDAASDIVVTGAKEFTRPSGLGMVSYRACYIAILAPGGAQTFARLFKKVKTESINGRTVWTWSRPPSEGYQTPINFYAALVTNSLFVLTINADDFREAANVLANGKVQIDVFGDPEMASLRAHAYWAYRKVRRVEGADVLASGINKSPASVRALDLFTQFDDGKLYFDILVQNGQSASVPTGLPSSQLIQFRRARAGVWRATISLTRNETREALFQVLAYFGYGVFL